MAEKRLADKVALVTGAGSGIGRAIAVSFAREGAWVGVNFFHDAEGAARTLELVLAEGTDGLLLQADVAEADQVAAVVRELEERWRRIDVLVNNSGIDEADWDRVLAANLKGALLVSRAVLPGMMARNSGAIVNISSILGILGNPKLVSSYAYKGGEVLLTRQMALEYAPHGVRVNCICPGFVLTERLAGFISNQEDPAGAASAYAAMAPLNRIGRPEEIATAAIFLASGAASFITGAVLPVDGGFAAWGGRDIL